MVASSKKIVCVPSNSSGQARQTLPRCDAAMIPRAGGTILDVIVDVVHSICGIRSVHCIMNVMTTDVTSVLFNSGRPNSWQDWSDPIVADLARRSACSCSSYGELFAEEEDWRMEEAGKIWMKRRWD